VVRPGCEARAGARCPAENCARWRLLPQPSDRSINEYASGIWKVSSSGPINNCALIPSAQARPRPGDADSPKLAAVDGQDRGTDERQPALAREVRLQAAGIRTSTLGGASPPMCPLRGPTGAAMGTAGSRWAAPNSPTPAPCGHRKLRLRVWPGKHLMYLPGKRYDGRSQSALRRFAADPPARRHASGALAPGCRYPPPPRPRTTRRSSRKPKPLPAKAARPSRGDGTAWAAACNPPQAAAIPSPLDKPGRPRALPHQANPELSGRGR